MVLFPGVIEGMVRNMSIKKKSNEDGEKEAAREMAKEAKRNKSMICLSGSVKTSKFDDMAYVCTKRGNKGINQDSLVVWEVPFSLSFSFSSYHQFLFSSYLLA